MTVVAVLEIHMDINAVANMNPRMIVATFVPINRMILRAILLWSPHFSIAMAIIKPPRYKKTYLCPKAAVVAFKSSPPASGNNIMGKSAVALIGMASVIHQTTIHSVVASTAIPAGERPSGRKKRRQRKKSIGPKTKPTVLEKCFFN